MTILYLGSKSPFNLLVESTGVKPEVETHACKHGGAKSRLRRKIHIGGDELTLEIRAVEVTGSGVYDAPMLLELLGQIPADFETAQSTTGANAWNKALRASIYLGRAIWPKWTRHQRRSRGETRVHRVKLLEQSFMAFIEETGAPRMVIGGQIDGFEKIEIMARAGIFALAKNIYHFTITATESLMLKVPVVSSDGAPWSGLQTGD